MKWFYVAYGFAWIATACVVGLTIWVTKNGAYLWAMFIPCFISFKSGEE